MARVITLPVIPDPVQMWALAEDDIIKAFKEAFFIPLIKEFLPDKVESSILRNSMDDLVNAIMTGRVSFNQGRFSGQFNSILSRELRRLGAEFDKKTSTYVIRESDLPIEIRSMVSVSEARLNRQLRKIDERLREFNPDAIIDKLNLTKIFDHTLYKVDKQFQKNVQKIAVVPQISPEQRFEIAWSWKENLNLYIKDFSDKQTLELRKLIEQSTSEGNRRESLIKDIQGRYGVTKNKAKFLARQETNLMMEAWTRSRYQDVGINEYYWRNVAGSANHPVRESHKALGDRSKKGETFKWTNPPLFGDNGQWCHPKQDYNCRCYAQPVVRL